MASLAEFLQAQQQFLNQPKATEYMRDIYESAALPSALNLKRLEEQKSFEDYANTQRLRELFAQSQGMPDIASVGQYSPEMAIKLQQAQLENLSKQAQIRESGMRTGKMGQEIQMEKGKAFANVIGPFADQYMADLQSGMPQGQALNKFRMQTGMGLRNLEQQGLKPDVPFDMNTLTPEAALRAASGYGYKSQFLDIQSEAAKRQLPPAPSSEQYYGGAEMTPYGPMRKPPVVGPNAQPFEVVQPAEMDGMQQAPIGQQDIDNLRNMYQQATGPDKERLGAMLAEAVKQQLPHGGSGFITPEQRGAAEVEREAAQTEAKEAVKSKVAEAEVMRQKAKVLSSLPKVPEINALIDKSMSGRIEEMAKGKIMGEMAGVSTEALTASKQLEVIAAQMKQITKALVGAGAVSDFEQKQMAEAAGNIADASTPAATRKAQLNTFNEIIRKSLQQPAEAATEAAPEEQAAIPGKPKIGEIKSGYMYKGGNPADPKSWEKQ